MKALIYKWNGISDMPAIKALEKIGIEVAAFEGKIKDYHLDTAFSQQMINVLHQERPNFVFSFDYFPIISSLCEINEISYVSWIYDCPTSARERERVIGAIAEVTPTQIYTGSELPETVAEKNTVVNKGYANYQTEMPLIFRESKINLNITSHTITSGIPLRVFDILACGGFCLTNYRPEIDEFFVDGEELVMFTDAEDACEKVAYYLAHEEERRAIAEKGHQKIVECFTMEKRLRELLKLWQEEKRLPNKTA